MKRLSSIVLSSALVLAAISARAIPRTALSKAQNAVQSQAPNQEMLEIFSGTIVSMNNGMVALKEDTKVLLYGLDNQVLARQFVDKKVSVTGTLDKKGTIHVKSIEEKKA